MKAIILKSILGIIILSELTSCNDEHKEVPSHKEEIRHEEVSKVEKGQPEKMVLLPGELKPWEWVDMFSKVKGFVKEVYVDRGSTVKKGQLLAILEAPELKAELARKQADLNEYKAKYKASKSTYHRLLQTSKTEGAVSENELDVAYSKMISDSSMVSSGEASIEAVREMVNYLRITAPFNGTVTERNVHPGALVGEDDKIPMFKMDNTTKLRLTVAIPEIYSSQIEPNCTVKFKVSAFPEHNFSACMARNSQALREDIRSLITEFDVENKNHLLKPGMYSELSIPIKRISSTMFVPSSAVVNSTEKVFVVKIENKKAKWVNVRKGNTIGGKVEIFAEDINPGDSVITKASEEIRDGETILPDCKEEKGKITMNDSRN
jgi:RND family efflux transporter MFP subunit